MQDHPIIVIHMYRDQIYMQSITCVVYVSLFNFRVLILHNLSKKSKGNFHKNFRNLYFFKFRQSILKYRIILKTALR